MVNRYASGSPEFRAASAKMLNTFILSMRGTPYCYYGDELGMTNIDFDNIGDYKDIAAINGYKKAKANGEDMDYFMRKLNFESRDNGRTPMQWDDSEQAGFTKGISWLSVNDNYKTINVADQEEDSNSVLNHFKKMTTLRKENPVLVYGKYELLQKEHPQIYAYTRAWEGEKMLVLLNFSEERSTIDIAEITPVGEVLINNYDSCDTAGTSVNLLPYQGVIFKLN